ncbi:MAG TPA: hypothetical protein VE980_21970 [Pyrinomonadaceae bacterium]|nr:hypothetical protein [Pyrinomonadaceae bacterium]
MIPRQTQSHPPKGSEAEEQIKQEQVSSWERLKFYTDLYKFYCELPLKIGAAYSLASTLTLLVTARLTGSGKIAGWVAVFIVLLGVGIIGWRLFFFDDAYIQQHRDEIERLTNELGIAISPSFQIFRLTLWLSVIFFILFPIVVLLILFFYEVWLG